MSELRRLDLECATLRGDEEKTYRDFVDNAPIGLRHYSTDANDARLLEDEIEKRGWDVQKRYIAALQDITECIPFDDVGYYWPLIRATPEQIARAFVQAVRP